MPKVKRRWSAEDLNEKTYGMYFNRLTELAISRYKWSGLPDTIDERFMELNLFNKGKCIFFFDEAMESYLALPCAAGGRLNVYQIPTDRTAYASNGYQARLTIDNSVLIYNNYTRTPSAGDVELFARRLADFDRTIDVNAKAQKTPVMILCDETQRLTMRNLYAQFEGNEPFIFGDKKLNANDVKTLNTNAPYVGDRISVLKEKVWNEALTYLGISNVSVEKKERLVSDEVERSQGGVFACRFSGLEARRQACKLINDMFGLNIWVDFREYSSEVDGAETETESEVNDNE